METQISLRLPASLASRIDRLARRRRVPRSSLVRALLVKALEDDGRKGEPDYPYARVRHLVGSLSGGPPDLSGRHSEYLKETIVDRR